MITYTQQEVQTLQRFWNYIHLADHLLQNVLQQKLAIFPRQAIVSCRGKIDDWRFPKTLSSFFCQAISSQLLPIVFY